MHLVNFGMYLFALGCFCFLMREMLRRQRSQRAELVAHGLVTLPDWALLALGYSLFIWSSLFLVTLQLESPDMLVAAFVYLATGMLLRIRRQPSKLGVIRAAGDYSRIRLSREVSDVVADACVSDRSDACRLQSPPCFAARRSC